MAIERSSTASQITPTWYTSMALFLLFLLSPLMGCDRLPSDTSLKRTFELHQMQFEMLAEISRSNDTVQQSHLQSLFHDLGIQGRYLREDFPSTLFFYVECRGTAITHDCKGYAYSPERLLSLQKSVDGAPPKIAFVSLTGNWYLFRDDD